MPIRVLVVDDDAVVRMILTEVINGDPRLQVIGVAADAVRAAEAIRQLKPDVVTLDVSMPGENGLVFLARQMREGPLPIVMISSFTQSGSESTLRALELGAVDFIGKPCLRPGDDLALFSIELRDKLRAAANSRLGALKPALGAAASQSQSGATLDGATLRDRLVLIGASTGGTEALKEVLTRFPAEMPGILMVQHMPEMFTGSFAKRLDGLSRLSVKEAEDGEPVKPGVAYLAPGHSHLLVKRGASGYVCQLSREASSHRHRPAVDVLFESAAKHVGNKAVGVILTGMGKDGAQGMLAMRHAGAWNIAQDEASCVVWGMPREAAANGAANEVVSLKDVANHVMNRLRVTERRTIAG